MVGIKGKYKDAFIEALYQKGFTQAFKNVEDFTSSGFCVNVGYTFTIR